jgi:hypothetical protein
MEELLVRIRGDKMGKAWARRDRGSGKDGEQEEDE